MVVLTVGVGCYGYISLSGFPRTFIIDTALSAPRFVAMVITLLCGRGVSILVVCS